MSNDRDRYVPKHKTPTCVPEFVEEDATGRYEGAELANHRAKRKTDERVARLEVKHDELAEVVTETRVLVGTMSGKLDAVLEHVTTAHREQQATERVRIGSRAKVIVGCATALGVVAGAIATVLAGGCS